MNKRVLREALLKMRIEQTDADIRAKSGVICEKVLCCAEYKSSQRVMVYLSFGGEVMTDGIIEHAACCGKEVFAPRLCGGAMEAAKIGGGFSKNKFGIPEPLGGQTAKPEDMELFIVPGVAFDADGNRLGFGKGFYDRFLEGARGFKIGIAFDFQIVENVACDSHDIPMDKVITEIRTFERGKR